MPLVANEIYADIQDAAVNAVVGLDDDLIGARVYARMFPDYSDVQFPCVFASVEGEMERLVPEECSTGGPGIGDDAGYDVWEYPVRLWIADNTQPRAHSRRRAYLRLRRAIIGLFNFKAHPLAETTPAVLAVQSARVEPEIVFDPMLPQYQHVVCGVRVFFKTAEDRETE